MGLFSNLMGWKLLGTATIKFYSEDEASVEYETKISDKVRKDHDLIQLFTLYYAKMLYNLNRGVDALYLIVCIQIAVKSVIGKDGVSRASILAKGKKLVKPKTGGITKKYSGELFEKSDQTRIIHTLMNWGGEGYYAPISTEMFLQYLINNLPETYLLYLVFVLMGMNKYYREGGDYSKVRSIIEAPNYGFNFASQVLKEIYEVE